MKNILAILGFLAIFLASCYEDLGNYDYKEINRIDRLEGVDSVVRVVQFDTLRLFPKFSATQYSESERFSYEWEIASKVVSTDQNLVFRANLSYGDKNCNFIITDREQGNKFLYPFRLIITGERAGDAVVVLSHYQGRAELSFKAVVPDTSRFAVNYYQDLLGMPLGTNPKGLFRNYISCEAYSGVLVFTDEGLKSLADTTLADFGNNAYLDEQFFQRQMVYPKPSIPEFHPQGIWSSVTNWVFFFGNFRAGESYTAIVADGKLYSFHGIFQNNVTCDAFLLGKQSPYGGLLSPVFSPVVVTPGVASGPILNMGYDCSAYKLMFDESVGRFLCVDGWGSGFVEVPETSIPAFEGWRLIYATHTNLPNRCVAVLAKGEAAKAVLLRLPANNTERVGTSSVPKVPFEVIAQMDMPSNVMNVKSDFYQFKAREYNLVSAGAGLYSGNVSDWSSGVAPAKVFDLSAVGYGSEAEITCFDVSRTEKTIVLGISRYGNDTEGKGDVLKGDVVYLDAVTYQVKKDAKGKDMIYRGICGYPEDIMIKWQSWYRDGKDQNGKVMDAI